MRAAYFGRTATAAELVRLGADINVRNGVRNRWRTEARSCPMARRAQMGETALDLAVDQNATSIVELLTRAAVNCWKRVANDIDSLHNLAVIQLLASPLVLALVGVCACGCCHLSVPHSCAAGVWSRFMIRSTCRRWNALHGCSLC